MEFETYWAEVKKPSTNNVRITKIIKLGQANHILQISIRFKIRGV